MSLSLSLPLSVAATHHKKEISTDRPIGFVNVKQPCVECSSQIMKDITRSIEYFQYTSKIKTTLSLSHTHTHTHARTHARTHTHTHTHVTRLQLIVSNNLAEQCYNTVTGSNQNVSRLSCYRKTRRIIITASRPALSVKANTTNQAENLCHRIP